MTREFKPVRFFVMMMAAALVVTAQKYFKEQRSGEQQSWDLAFANGYTNGFKKTHHRE